MWKGGSDGLRWDCFLKQVQIVRLSPPLEKDPSILVRRCGGLEPYLSKPVCRPFVFEPLKSGDVQTAGLIVNPLVPRTIVFGAMAWKSGMGGMANFQTLAWKNVMGGMANFQIQITKDIILGPMGIIFGLSLIHI